MLLPSYDASCISSAVLISSRFFLYLHSSTLILYYGSIWLDAVRSNTATTSNIISIVCLPIHPSCFSRRILQVDAVPCCSSPGEIITAKSIHNKLIVQLRVSESVIEWMSCLLQLSDDCLLLCNPFSNVSPLFSFHDVVSCRVLCSWYLSYAPSCQTNTMTYGSRTFLGSFTSC